MSLQTQDLVAGIKRRPVLFVCGVLALLFAVAIYFRGSVPTELRARLTEREKELTRLSNNVKFSAQLDGQLEALRAANAVIEQGALRIGELARNQQLFLRLEAESGVKLVDLRQLTTQATVATPAPKGKAAAAAAPSGIYEPIRFSLNVQGDYPQLIDFLKRLDQCPTLSRLASANTAQPTEGTQSLSLIVELLGFRS